LYNILLVDEPMLTEAEIKKEPVEKEENENCDYHRNDEQVNVCLEGQDQEMKSLRRKFLRLSSQATVSHLKKYIALKLFNDMTRFTDVSLRCVLDLNCLMI
jgi:polycomb group RING finger protein 3